MGRHVSLRRAVDILLVSLTASPAALALPVSQLPDGRPAIELSRAAAPVNVDGSLEDAAWQAPALDLPEWLTYNPVSGQTLAQRTEVRLSYDDSGLYIAFHCLDPEPDKVRATLSRRDQLWTDDWVGVSLDAIGNGQQSYDLFVNARGVQGDILNTATAGENSSPDWVWDSAGRQTPEGYDVEIRVPWKSIRFTSGHDVRMGVIFWRRVSRLGISASWPALLPNRPFFQTHAALVLRGDLRRPLALELVPSATYARNEERASPAAFGEAENQSDLGVSVKYGLTSTATVEGTLNPDFSQVESDAFQMEVNQRYPVFYSEKRPFFMEGMGTFELAGVGGDAVMRTAVHTRRIVDPAWGAKSSGSAGRLSFAVLAAGDEAPGRAPDAPLEVRSNDQLFLVGRTTWGFSRSSYLGLIATDSELGSGYNRVIGADLSLRRGSHGLSGSFLSSRSRGSDGLDDRSGLAGQALYSYETKRYVFVTQTEHYDRDFRMDTAFINQTGITSNWTYGQLSLYPNEKRHPWFKRLSPFFFGRLGRDRDQGGDLRFGMLGVRANFTRQGYVRVDSGWGLEPWKQVEHRTRVHRLMGGAQLLRWLNIDAYLSAGRSIDYEAEAPYVGPSWSHSLTLSLQRGARLSQSVSWERFELSRPGGDDQAFQVDLLNTRTTYQFDRRFALRGILRYDSSRKRVLADLLASFEPVPGTVAYAGYGSLFERRGWDGSDWRPGEGDYLTTRRGIFFKVSYAKRF